MNKTKIDWATASWNPVTGCLHGCEYCYARGIAHRFCTQQWRSGGWLHELYEPKFYDNSPGGDFDMPQYEKDPYPYEFDPTFHRYRLNEPAQKKKPVNIFVCSMADLFGEWVPDEWIKAVFDACAAAPQHNYLFLTKNPIRYASFIQSPLDFRRNMLFGATATDVESFNEMSDLLAYHHINSASKVFMSIEPLLDRINTPHLYKVGYFNWVIIGAESGNRKGKIIPRREWVAEIVDQCGASGVPVFLKSSLAGIWGEQLIQEYPPELQAVADGMKGVCKD